MLGLIKRTCYFITDYRTRRQLYLTLVRSNFEHCSIVWRPHYNSDITKFEALQKKKAVKWIKNEAFINYSHETYILKCKEPDLLPIEFHFKLNDLLFFHKIVNKLIPVSLPSYIIPYGGSLRLRSTFLDPLSYICDKSLSHPVKTNTNSVFYRSFYYRTMHQWNALPLNVKQLLSYIAFKLKARNFLWEQLLNNIT